MVNLRHWEELPPLYKAALEAACAEGYCHLAARYDALNPPALRRLIANGAQLRPFPREVMSAFYRAAQELWEEIGARNPRFRSILEHFERYKADQQPWFRVAEDSFAVSMAQPHTSLRRADAARAGGLARPPGLGARPVPDL